MNAEGNDAAFVAKTIIERTQLLSILLNDNTPENISRQENLAELINGVTDFVEAKQEEDDENILLSDYLAQISLMTDQDDENNDGDSVTLMTVHAAKGLEFKNVIIVGVEEDLFPSYMSVNSLRDIEEERRLLYVAITRAKSTCILTYTSSRFINGQTKACTISRFVKDIDPEYLDLSNAGNEALTPTQNKRQRIEWSPQVRQAYTPTRTTRPTSASTPVRTTSATLGNKNFSIHSVTELSTGTLINHSRFGEGEIITIDKSGADAKIQVNFKDVGPKTLLLKFAKFEILQ